MKQRLCRSKQNKILGGVAGGIGEFFEIDPVIIRIIFVILAAFGGTGVVIYLVLWLLLPDTDGVSVAENFAAEIKKEECADCDSDHKSAKNKGSIEISESKKIFGALLIVFGLYLLISRILPNLNLGVYLWPSLIILFGLFIVYKSTKSK